MFLEVDDKRIWCDVYGDGSYPLLIPSFAGIPHLERSLPKFLRKLFKIIIIEPTGGGRNLSELNFTLEDLADDLERVRNFFNLRKVFLLGWSSNGYITSAFAKKYEEYVLGHVIIGVPTRYDKNLIEEQEKYWNENASEKRKSIFDANLRVLKEKMKTAKSKEEAIILEYCANSPKYFYDETFDCLPLWEGNIFQAEALEYFFKKVIAGKLLWDQLPGNMKTLWIQGKYDFKVPYYILEEELKGKKNIDYYLFENSGHFPFLEEEDLFEKTIMSWIKKL